MFVGNPANFTPVAPTTTQSFYFRDYGSVSMIVGKYKKIVVSHNKVGANGPNPSAWDKDGNALTCPTMTNGVWYTFPEDTYVFRVYCYVANDGYNMYVQVSE